MAGSPTASIEIAVNGRTHAVQAEPGTPLLYVPGSLGTADCLLFQLRDGNNMNICHFAGGGRTDILGESVSRGTVLGTAGSPWMHLSIDARPTSCSGGWTGATSYPCPVPFAGANAFEGQELTPNGDADQWVESVFTSSNSQT